MTLLAQMALQGTIGFCIGAGTNELAIRWVFNTLFTKKKKLIATNTKHLIRTELMTSEKIAAKLCSPEVREVIERNIRLKLDESGDKVRSILARFGQCFEPHLPMLVKEEVRAFAEIAELFDDNFRSAIASACANQVTAYLTENLPRMIEETDVWNIVYETIMGYDERKMEVLTREIANRELRGVTLWGGVIGAGVGFATSVLVWWIG